jgi:ribosomal protein S18 acetylase RimI-like enzyme
VQVRLAQPADTSAIRDLVQRAYGPYVVRIGRRPAPMDDDYGAKVEARLAFVAEEAGGITGLIVLLGQPDHMLVENVAVDPDRQSEGIGRELLAFAETSAREAGVAELRLYTNAAMTENLAFYPRLGYEETGRRTDNGFKRVFFSKSLDR